MKRIKKSIKSVVKRTMFKNQKIISGNFYFSHDGYCPCCEENVTFVSTNSWLRDHFICTNCKSIPRERALMLTIEKYYPNWKDLNIHESSPGNRGHSIRLKKGAKDYTESQFFGNENLGEMNGDVRNENLEDLTYSDNTFDLLITSDVMEHVYDPDKAFNEIHRVLKPGGAHIFSVPLVNKFKPTERWANKGTNGEPIFLHEPEWHGNPIDDKGSPVTMHWGYDIVDRIKKCTQDDCFIEYMDDLAYGIRAEYIEIVVSRKS